MTPAGLRALILLAVGAGVAWPDQAAGQSAPPARNNAAEEAEVAKTMRNARRALRLSPIVLSNDTVLEGETLFAAADLVNREVEELVLGPHMARKEWRIGGVQWWVERLSGGTKIPAYDQQGSATRGRQYAAGGSVIQLQPGEKGVVIIRPRDGTNQLWRPSIATGPTGLVRGAYELTVEVSDLETKQVIEVRKARFTVQTR